MLRFCDACRDAFRVEAERETEPGRVIGDGQVRIALVARAARHRREGVAAIGPVGVGMQVALDVGDGEEHG